MLKTTNADAEEHVGFFIIVSSIFREKSTRNRAKRMKTIIVHKNQQKNNAWNALFLAKTRF